MSSNNGQHKKKAKITDYFRRQDRPTVPNEIASCDGDDNDHPILEDQDQDVEMMDKSPESQEDPASIEINEGPFVKLVDVLTDTNLHELSLERDTYVLYHQPWCRDQVPEALSPTDNFRNSTNYIKLPFQDDTLIEHEGVPTNKWKLIQKLLDRKFENIFQLEKTIKVYNPYVKHFEFDILRSYINYQLNDDEKEYFFDQLLPAIIRLALDLPNAITCNLPILDQGTSTTLFLSQYQICTLLANAFLCTYTSRFKEDRRCINFVMLYSTNRIERRKGCKLEKVKCLINYFRKAVKNMPSGTVSFERKHLATLPVLEDRNKRISKFEINSGLCMFKHGNEYAQVDFANKFIGGGVLNSGCVQEEILCVICPELIVGRLFTEKLWEKDALLITGVEQYSQYSGYGDSFKWKSSIEDSLERDKYGRKLRQVIAMNATPFRIPKAQFEKSKIDQEITKALSAFQAEKFIVNQSRLPAIATGNWGCGVYRGDPYLKTLIQIIAASIMNRDLVYFAFDNDKLKEDFEEIKSLLERRPRFTVGQLYRATLEFAAHKINNTNYNLVGFLSQKLL